MTSREADLQNDAINTMLGLIGKLGTDFAHVLKLANDFGIWSLLTFITGTSIAGLLWVRQRRRVQDFTIYTTYTIGTGHPLYPNTINIEVRNLMHAPVVINRPNFRFHRRLNPGRHAHGHSATGDYEVKFRMLNSDGSVESGLSWTLVTLRHRERAFAYIPIDDSLSEADLIAKMREGTLGRLFLDLVRFDGPRPEVTSMVVPLSELVRGPDKPPLGAVNSLPVQNEKQLGVAISQTVGLHETGQRD